MTVDTNAKRMTEGEKARRQEGKKARKMDEGKMLLKKELSMGLVSESTKTSSLQREVGHLSSQKTRQVQWKHHDLMTMVVSRHIADAEGQSYSSMDDGP